MYLLLFAPCFSSFWRGFRYIQVEIEYNAYIWATMTPSGFSSVSSTREKTGLPFSWIKGVDLHDFFPPKETLKVGNVYFYFGNFATSMSPSTASPQSTKNCIEEILWLPTDFKWLLEVAGKYKQPKFWPKDRFLSETFIGSPKSRWFSSIITSKLFSALFWAWFKLNQVFVCGK